MVWCCVGCQRAHCSMQRDASCCGLPWSGSVKATSHIMGKVRVLPHTRAPPKVHAGGMRPCACPARGAGLSGPLLLLAVNAPSGHGSGVPMVHSISTRIQCPRSVSPFLRPPFSRTTPWPSHFLRLASRASRAGRGQRQARSRAAPLRRWARRGRAIPHARHPACMGRVRCLSPRGDRAALQKDPSLSPNGVCT